MNFLSFAMQMTIEEARCLFVSITKIHVDHVLL